MSISVIYHQNIKMGMPFMAVTQYNYLMKSKPQYTFDVIIIAYYKLPSVSL